MAAYNLSQLRILWEIASDGLRYQSIKNASLQVYGDFSALNLKSDIVEQVWRTSAIEDAWFQIDCGEPEDVTKVAQKSVVFDTIAFLNHNLTASAEVKVWGYGSSPATSAPADRSVFYKSGALVAQMRPLADVTETNLIWVSPTQPKVPYRHYLVEIKDPRNPDGYIQVGRFLAGEATIFSEEENFEAVFNFQEVSYKDEVKINGFTSISNARSLKKRLRVSFDNLDATRYRNYYNFKRYARYCRDTLKALVIPDSKNPYLFSVFAKMREMPDEKFKYLDGETTYVSLEVEWDEAK